MMNSSSLFKAIGGIAVTLVSLLTAAVADWFGMTAVVSAATIVGIAAAVAGIIYLLKARRAMIHAAEVCGKLSRGDFEARILDIREGGEIGALMYALNDMIDRCDAYIRESTAAMNAVQQNKFFRRVLPEGLHGALLNATNIINAATDAMRERVGGFNNLTQQFETAINTVVDSLTEASGEMAKTSEVLSNGASTTKARATTAAAASEEATANMQTVAAATTELSTSAREVGHEVNRSADIVRQAVEKVDDATRTVKSLSLAADRIGEVIELINAIAAQTNLLALNATIEAARAGELGKGFAVVAQEVKLLAGQTSKATSEVSGHINEVQSITKNAVDAIDSIGKIIAEVDKITSHVMEAVNSQTSATNEIAQNVEQAFAGIRDITVNLHTVTENAGETEAHADTTKVASGGLSEQAIRLANEVRDYLVSMRKGMYDRRHFDDPSYRGEERRAEYRSGKKSKHVFGDEDRHAA